MARSQRTRSKASKSAASRRAKSKSSTLSRRPKWKRSAGPSSATSGRSGHGPGYVAAKLSDYFGATWTIYARPLPSGALYVAAVRSPPKRYREYEFSAYLRPRGLPCFESDPHLTTTEINRSFETLKPAEAGTKRKPSTEPSREPAGRPR